jgi:hypothetical protein
MKCKNSLLKLEPLVRVLRMLLIKGREMSITPRFQAFIVVGIMNYLPNESRLF